MNGAKVGPRTARGFDPLKGVRTPTINVFFSPFGSGLKLPRLMLDNVKHQPVQIRTKNRNCISLIHMKNALQWVLHREFSNHSYKFMNILQWNTRNTITNASKFNPRSKGPTRFAIGCTGTRHHMCIDCFFKLCDSILQ